MKARQRWAATLQFVRRHHPCRHRDVEPINFERIRVEHDGSRVSSCPGHRAAIIPTAARDVGEFVLVAVVEGEQQRHGVHQLKQAKVGGEVLWLDGARHDRVVRQPVFQLGLKLSLFFEECSGLRLVAHEARGDFRSTEYEVAVVVAIAG